MHTVVTQLTDAPQFMYTPAHTHCTHLHAHCMQAVQTTSFSAFEKFSLSVSLCVIIVTQILNTSLVFYASQDSFQVFSAYGSFTLCYPSFSCLLSHSLLLHGMANRLGMMVGGVEKVFDSNWYHRLFLQYIKQKHKDSGSLSVFRLTPLGTKWRQE